MADYKIQMRDGAGNKQYPVTLVDAVVDGNGRPLTQILSTYTHTQGSASSEWVINHGLGKYPSVTIVDSAGSVVHGDVIYDNDQRLTVRFTSAFSGKAYLN